MSVISIEWLSDSSECECCGYNYAEGATVLMDGKPLLELKPAASCFGGDHYDTSAVYGRILEALGHEVVE